ncbi:MAG: hypothetical protein JW958_06390 [Candidatus Eisenbacteria bacterium]|nr:hypothetical protein [Candidatus Eisenbacteria bacterium]
MLFGGAVKNARNRGAAEGKDPHPSLPRLEVRFTLGLVLFVLVVINVGGWLFYEKARGYMENANGRRLVSWARAAAAQVDKERLYRFVPGDESSAPYAEEAEKMRRLRDEAELDNLFLVAPYQGSLLDTRPDIPVGWSNPLVELESEDLSPLWAGEAVRLPLYEIEGEPFQGVLAPVLEEGELRAVVGADASARFLDDLRILRRALLLTALLSLVVAGGLALFVSRNARRLVALQGEIKDAERLAALGTLTAGLAHEIRNPLAIIRASAELLQEEHSGGTAGDRFAGEILGEVDRLGGLLEGFLDFARPDRLEKKRIDLAALADKTCRRVEAEFRDRGIRLERDIPPETTPVDLDPLRIEQVLLNLIWNARDALDGRGGRVEISVRRRRRAPSSAIRTSPAAGRDGFVEVRVADDGPGIPEEVRDKLFDPFFTTRKRGTGLGLSIAHGIVQGHGGYLFVESDRGGGATVGFGLPV